MSKSTIVDRLAALFETTPPFNLLPEEVRTEMLTDVSVEYFQPGEVILEQGLTVQKGLYIVESGLVRLMDLESHRLIDKCAEGEFFGSFNLIKGGALIYQAKAVEATVCAVLLTDRFQRLLQEYEDIEAFFQRDIKRYVRHIDKEMDVTGAHLLFSRRLTQYPHRGVVRCAPDATVAEAARIMRDEGVDSIIVEDRGRLSGILTDGDIRNRLVAENRSPDEPVRAIMSSPVFTVSSESSLFEAMMEMLRNRVDRLVIVDTERRPPVAAVVTDRDVAYFRGQDPVATVQRIDRAMSVSDLVTIRTDTSEQLLRLYRQGVQPEMLNSIMSVIYDCLVMRLLALAELELEEKHGELKVALPWAWLRLGSGGRQEMVLNSQQHNAIVYANPSSNAEAAQAEKWFGMLAERVTSGLESCAFAVSDVVARQPEWRRPVRQWKHAYREWILQADSRTLTSAALFFDLRSIYGDASLVEEMRRDIVDALNVQALDTSRHFFRMMAANALTRKPPVSFLGRFQLERRGEHRGTFDIRERGVLPVVDAVRVLALEHRYMTSTNTFDRLRFVASESPHLADVLEESIEAYRFLVDFRLEDQLTAYENGEKLDNQIEPLALRKVQQNLLRTVFATVTRLQEVIADRYGLRK